MSNKNNFDESEMAAYAQSIEGTQITEMSMPAEDAPKVEQKKEEKQPTVEPQRDLVGMQMRAQAKSSAEAHAEREEEIRKESEECGIGNAVIPVESLPSKGLFYPVGTRIYIRSASLGDIKRWSAMNEDDMVDVMEKMKSIFESCCTVNFGPDTAKRARYKDLLDLDRLYILFAIHDWTFPSGKNDVNIKVSEKEDIPVWQSKLRPFYENVPGNIFSDRVQMDTIFYPYSHCQLEYWVQ